MFKLNFFNPQFNSYLILLLSLTTLIFEVSLYNQLFFVLVLLFSILQNIYTYRFKNIISLFIGIIAIYIQFKLSSETLSKEFFLNLVLLLIFIKFSEAKNKNDYFFSILLQFFYRFFIDIWSGFSKFNEFNCINDIINHSFVCFKSTKDH